MPSLSPTVFVIDDDTSFLTSVVRLLRASGFNVKPYASASAFLAELSNEAGGCVVADLQMPGMNGIELQDALAKTDNPLPVIFLTGRGDLPTSVTAMRHGAEDFLEKCAPKEQLLDAVRRALARDEKERRQHVRQRELQTRFARLTPREREVLTHVLTGQINKQIAADLFIDERSVKRHRTSLMSKLKIQSVVELARIAQEAGIAAPSDLSSTRP